MKTNTNLTQARLNKEIESSPFDAAVKVISQNPEYQALAQELMESIFQNTGRSQQAIQKDIDSYVRVHTGPLMESRNLLLSELLKIEG